MLPKNVYCLTLIFTMHKSYLKITSLIIALFFSAVSFSQSLSINTTGSIADTTAILDVSSTAKGLLIPRMTATQKTGIVTPATGLLVYQTDGQAGFYYFNGTSWLLLITSAVNTDKQNTLIYTTKGF
jgi:hypothetical protein